MLIRDRFGYFYDVPDERFSGWVAPGLGEIAYDGFGNPLGFPALAALLPLAAKFLPMAASLLPGLTSSAPPPAQPPAPVRAPAAPPVAPVIAPPQVIVIREPAPAMPAGPQGIMRSVQALPRVRLHRRRGRRRPVRVKVERLTEQVTVPPPAALPPPQTTATEASGGMNGWYPAPHFGRPSPSRRSSPERRLSMRTNEMRRFKPCASRFDEWRRKRIGCPHTSSSPSA